MTGFRDSVHVFCIAEIIGPYVSIMIGWYTRFLFSTLLSAVWTLDADWQFFFYQRRHESSALPRPPPPLLYHLAIVITSADSAHSHFANRDRKAALSNFSSMLWYYYCCEITNKKYTFWDMNWNELWILLTLNRPPPPIFTSKFRGGCASPDEPPLLSTLFIQTEFILGVLMNTDISQWKDTCTSY